MWFFFLRAEDLPRLKAEWFRSEEGKGGSFVICRLGKQRATAPSAKPTTSDQTVTKSGNESRESPVATCCSLNSTETASSRIRFLLSKAKESCGVAREGLSTTQVRHTAFRLLLEEDPQLHSVVG